MYNTTSSLASAGVVVVDVANPTRRETAALKNEKGYKSAAEYTRSTLASNGAQCEVVKAFNTLAAYPLLVGSTYASSISTIVAGDSVEASGPRGRPWGVCNVSDSVVQGWCGAGVVRVWLLV